MLMPFGEFIYALSAKEFGLLCCFLALITTVSCAHSFREAMYANNNGGAPSFSWHGALY